jgi:hypothetical protein
VKVKNMVPYLPGYSTRGSTVEMTEFADPNMSDVGMMGSWPCDAFRRASGIVGGS